MTQVRFTVFLSLIVALATGCGQVGLERSSKAQETVSAESAAPQEPAESPAIPLAPGEGVLSALQLLDPQTVGDLLDGVTDCDALETDAFSCLLLMDSFERSAITAGDGAFAWSYLVDDVAGSNGSRVEANIYNESQMGMTPQAITGSNDDQGRSVLFTGRPGGSVHSIFLVSKPLDLSDYNTVMVGFEYLAIELEIWNWAGKTGSEHIRLEVCEADLSACGVQPSLDSTGLNSVNWVSKYQNAAGEGAGLNGHDHSLSDWSQAAVNIDISSLSASVKANFVFRLTVTIDEGFLGSGITGNLEDGIALDNVVALASKRTIGTDVPTPPPVDEPIPNGPSIE